VSVLLISLQFQVIDYDNWDQIKSYLNSMCGTESGLSWLINRQEEMKNIIVVVLTCCVLSLTSGVGAVELSA